MVTWGGHDQAQAGGKEDDVAVKEGGSGGEPGAQAGHSEQWHQQLATLNSPGFTYTAGQSFAQPGCELTWRRTA